MYTPDSAAAGPTVGANCRGGITGDAMGWLKVGAMSTLVAPGTERIQARIRGNMMYPGSGPSCGGKPLLLLVCLGLSRLDRLTTIVLLELYV